MEALKIGDTVRIPSLILSKNTYIISQVSQFGIFNNQKNLVDITHVYYVLGLTYKYFSREDLVLIKDDKELL